MIPSIRNPSRLLHAMALLAAASPAPAYAPDVFKVCRLNPKGDNFLALRDGPGTSYRMLAKLPPGTEVADWDRKGPWYLVTGKLRQEFEGWVHSDYLCLIEDH